MSFAIIACFQISFFIGCLAYTGLPHGLYQVAAKTGCSSVIVHKEETIVFYHALDASSNPARSFAKADFKFAAHRVPAI